MRYTRALRRTRLRRRVVPVRLGARPVSGALRRAPRPVHEERARRPHAPRRACVWWQRSRGRPGCGSESPPRTASRSGGSSRFDTAVHGPSPLVSRGVVRITLTGMLGVRRPAGCRGLPLRGGLCQHLALVGADARAAGPIGGAGSCAGHGARRASAGFRNDLAPAPYRPGMRALTVAAALAARDGRRRARRRRPDKPTNHPPGGPGSAPARMSPSLRCDPARGRRRTPCWRAAACSRPAARSLRRRRRGPPARRSTAGRKSLVVTGTLAGGASGRGSGGGTAARSRAGTASRSSCRAADRMPAPAFQ